MQYKTYSLNYTTNVLGRTVGQSAGSGISKAGNIMKNFSTLFIGTMVAGYAGEVLKSFLKNRSIPPITGRHADETWSRAMLGPMGFYGDVAGAIMRHPYNALTELAGPVVSDVSDFATYVYEMEDRTFGEKPHRKSRGLLTAQILKRNLPFTTLPSVTAFMNYSLGKGIINHFYPGEYERQMHNLNKYTGQEPILHH